MSNEASCSKSWADIFKESSSSEDDENMVEGSDLEIDSDLETRVVESDVERNEKSCICLSFADSDLALNYMYSLLEDNETNVLVNCLIDNLSRCFNLHIENHHNTDSVERLIFCDLFYRVRHEEAI